MVFTFSVTVAPGPGHPPADITVKVYTALPGLLAFARVSVFVTVTGEAPPPAETGFTFVSAGATQDIVEGISVDNLINVLSPLQIDSTNGGPAGFVTVSDGLGFTKTSRTTGGPSQPSVAGVMVYLTMPVVSKLFVKISVMQVPAVPLLLVKPLILPVIRADVHLNVVAVELTNSPG
jgi:hypothetical protein